jgi:tetratricopeptide (TPR) repeat protein
VRLANLHTLILLCGFIVAILVANLTSALAGTPPAVGVFVLLAAINIFVVRPRAWAWLWRRAFLRLSHAIVGQDVERALELADNLAAQATTRGTREFLVANRGIALVMGEQWKSGTAVLRGVDRGLLSPLARLVVDNDLAWGLTHAGAHDEAIALARATAEAARADKTLEPVFLGCCIGTLGAALVRANMPEPGLVHLREAHAIPAPPRASAARLLYIGDAEEALGRAAEARAAWGDAARLSPDSPWGRHAAERLKSASPVPYR